MEQSEPLFCIILLGNALETLFSLYFFISNRKILLPPKNYILILFPTLL